MPNILAGIAQPIVAALATWAITKGYVTVDTLAGVGTFLAGVAAVITSAVTTIVQK